MTERPTKHAKGVSGDFNILHAEPAVHVNVPTFNHQLIQFIDRLHRLPTRPDRTGPACTSAIPLRGWSRRDPRAALARSPTTHRARTFPWQWAALELGLVHLFEINRPFHIVFETLHLCLIDISGTCGLGEVAEVLSRLDHLGPPFHGRFTGEPKQTSPEVMRCRQLFSSGSSEFHIAGLIGPRLDQQLKIRRPVPDGAGPD